MATTSKSHLGLILFSICFFSFASLSLSESDTPTVYEILPKYGLPSGLLPNSVVNYTLSSDGGFVVVLDKPCYVQFDYLVYYETTISGKLQFGSITDLQGIQVKRLFFWFDVAEIRVDLPPSDNIYFQVGFINKKLDVSQFKTVHACRDSVSGSACLGSLKQILQLLAPVNENIEMLVTE